MRVDFHIHSRISEDGRLSIGEILAVLKARNISAAAITDHNSIRGALSAREEAKGSGIVIVRGTEVSSSRGHIAALGIDQDVPRGLTPEETVEKIHSLGGVAIAVHPYRLSTGLGGDVVRKCKFDAIEILNGWASNHQNSKAARLASELNLSVTAGSDGHRGEEIGKAYGIIEQCETEEQIIDAVLRGKVRCEGMSRTTGALVRDAFWSTLEWARRGFRRL
ncbi:MAG: CehA/McbA family metallohydrolase [Thermoplasmata archaeon]